VPGIHSVCGATCTYLRYQHPALTHSAAGYAQATAPITQRLRLTGGVRSHGIYVTSQGGYDADTGAVYGAGNQEKGWSNVATAARSTTILLKASSRTRASVRDSIRGYFNGALPRSPSHPRDRRCRSGHQVGVPQPSGASQRSGFHYDYDNIVLKQVQSFGTILLLMREGGALRSGCVFDFVATIT